MKKILSFFLLFLIILAYSAVFSSVGFYLGRNYQKIYQPPADVDMTLFWQTWYTIHDRFPDKERVDNQRMIEGAISGMVESLQDPHTRFFTQEEAKDFIRSMEGEFEGVGMKIDIRDENLQVIAPIKETPAYRAGLRSGDKILKIDGISTADMTTEEAVAHIRGPKGTEVVLIIFREEWNENREIRIKRDVIKVPSLSWELLEQNIAYLKLYYFMERTENDFTNTANEILASPAEKIILDLRDNPGGYLDVAKNITGWFLNRGQVIVIQDFGEGKQEIFRSRGPGHFSKYPVIILINEGSASGSEILAGALRDNRGIKIIGETSFGKGSVQELTPLKEGASLKITIANWLTPNGELIANKGLKPDIVVEKTTEDLKQDKDPQLDKAIEIIKKM